MKIVTADQMRIGFRLGIYSADEVQEWVDIQFKICEEIPDYLLELAFAKGNMYDVYDILKKFPSIQNSDDALILALQDVNVDDLSKLEFCRHFAARLHQYYVEMDCCVAEKLGGIAGFDDELALAEKGMGTTVEMWHQNFLSFVAGFSKEI